MIEQVQKLYGQLIPDLEALDETHVPDLFLPDQRLKLISETISPLKDKLPWYEFSSVEEEIRFFKTVFPPIISLLVYYTEMAGLEISDLIGTRKSRAEYRSRLLKRIDDFSAENGDLYDYCSRRQTNFDAYYFLRSSPTREAATLFGSVVDPTFCPAFSIKLSMMSAYHRLDEKLTERLADKNEGHGLEALSKLTWTGTKVALTELLYPLQKYVNHGDCTMLDLVNGFQYLFNTDLGNYSRSFQEVLRRKKSDTHFLSQLMNDLQEKIEYNEKERMRKRGFK
jgi:hypothetical protein